MRTYLRFWGKAAGELAEQAKWHPLAYHCLDVAAVADRLLSCTPTALDVMARLMTTNRDNARRVLVCLIALHDVGKFSAAFQGKAQFAWPTDVLGALAPMFGGRHDADGYAMADRLKLKELLVPAMHGWLSSEFNLLWAAVAGHHGQPPMAKRANLDEMKPPCWDAAHMFCADVCALFGPFEAIGEPDEQSFSALSWAVAGLTVVSDWIGSSRACFPYRAPDLDLAHYWAVARFAAQTAVAKAGILPVAMPATFLPAKLFPKIDVFSPLQRHVTDMPLPSGPTLTIIEDVTGSGKTEAAVLLAARLLHAGRADGLFFALPTMATANAMYERLGGSYRCLFNADGSPSLVLAHGKRKLHPGFANSILEMGVAVGALEADAQGNDAGSACAAWIADDRRKAFLAHVGVGTIDQALLGVLPSRHQSLRLWALSNRILIIDEAHAYDAYMSREIETLLEFHAALGGSAIVLSATLAHAQRWSLASAFARGLGGKRPAQISGDAYPMLTSVSAAGCMAHPVASRADRARSLPVRRISGFDEAAAYVEAVARKGAATAWIRNSVDDAIEAAEVLRAKGLEVVLLHARFAMGDRLDIEERVRRVLGPGDGSGARRGFVLVGTQILEQSLDYDVDAMVSDLAPVDLLIQRAGRLWRHSDRCGRPLDTPELLVLSPDPDQVDNKDWYRSISPRAAAIYDHHGIVWRSAKVLFETGCISTPAGVRGLVESVYANLEFDDVPAPLRNQSNRADGKRSAARSIAGANLLKCRDGYGGSVDAWSKDTLTPTRLGQETTLFRLGKIEAGGVAPFYRSDISANDLARDWALSEVSLNRKKATGVPVVSAGVEKLVAAAKLAWSEWERDVPLLLLEPEGVEWRGAVMGMGEAIAPVVYRGDVGLRIEPV